MTNDERKAVERAQAALSTLTPATALNGALANDLRQATQLMGKAAEKSFSSQAALNNLRGEASLALNEVLGTPMRTQELIERARRALAAVLDQLPSASVLTGPWRR